MEQLLETKDKGLFTPEWTEAMYGYENSPTVTEAKLDSIIEGVEQVHFFQYCVCVCGMALLGVLTVMILSWLFFFFMNRRLLRGQQQQLEEEMMTTMCNDDETTSYNQCIINGAAEGEAAAAAAANNDYEVFPKWLAHNRNKLRAQISFENKARYVGLFYSRQAATIALDYAEKKLQGLKKRKLSEKETGQEMNRIANEAQEYAKQCVPTERHAPTVRRKCPKGVSRNRKKFQAQLLFNKKTRYIGLFKTVRAAVIAHDYTKKALKDFRSPALKLSEKETIEIMEGIVKVAQEMGNRYDGENHAGSPIPTLPVVVAGEGGTNTAARQRQPRIATRKRSPATTTSWEETSTRSSKRLKRAASISAGARSTRSRAQSTSGEDMCLRTNNKRHKK